jgi:uncharacterized protein YxjI
MKSNFCFGNFTRLLMELNFCFGLGMQYPGTGGGMHSSGMGGGYVQPPQNIQQTTGLTPGAGGMGGTGGYGGAGAMGGTGAMGVVGQQYVAQTVKSYAVTKKRMSVSGGDWTITDQMGQNAFRVDGRIASMRDRRFLRDASNNRILTMKKKLITLHDTWEIYAGESNTVLATCKKSSLVQVRTAMDVNLASSTTSKHNPDYQVKGDFFDRNITIFRGVEQAALVRTLKVTYLAVALINYWQ